MKTLLTFFLIPVFLFGESAAIFLKMMEEACIEEMVQENEVTIFVPVDEAFAFLDGDKEQEVLFQHIVLGDCSSECLVSGESLFSLEGEEIPIWGDEKGVMVNDAEILLPDIPYEFSDGRICRIHLIDRLINYTKGG